MNETLTFLRFEDLDNKVEAKDLIMKEIASLLDRNDEVNISAIALNDEYKLSTACINYRANPADDKAYGAMDIKTNRWVSKDLYTHLLHMQHLIDSSTDLFLEDK